MKAMVAASWFLVATMLGQTDKAPVTGVLPVVVQAALATTLFRYDDKLESRSGPGLVVLIAIYCSGKCVVWLEY